MIGNVESFDADWDDRSWSDVTWEIDVEFVDDDDDECLSNEDSK